MVLKLLVTCLLAALVGNGYAEKPLAPHSLVPAHYSTPPGIILIEVAREMSGARSVPLWTQLGGAHGETLYVYEQDKPGVSNCHDDCAREFPPVLADTGAKAFGDWTLVSREEGRQWAYRDQPLYSFARESHTKKFGEVMENIIEERTKNDNRDVISRQAGKDGSEKSEAEKLLPPDGWQPAEYTLAQDTVVPVEFEVKLIAAANVTGLVDAAGMTLYAFADSEEVLASCQTCNDSYLPVPAGELTVTVGDFTAVRRVDGTRQWAFRGAPLYRFTGDLAPGDINGIASSFNDVDKRWYIPALAKHFVPSTVVVRKDPVRDLILIAGGKPLYSRYVHQYMTSADKSVYHLYYRGKQLLTRGCDTECEKNWQPFIAGDSARSQGYWEVIKREDGLRQWAYQGFAVYTNVQDKINGVAAQSHTYDYLHEFQDRYSRTEIIPDYDEPFSSYFTGLVWRVSSP